MKPGEGNNMSSRWRAPTLDCEKRGKKERRMNMNEYYPGSKSYLLFHPCSPASFCSLWTTSLKAAAWRSSLAVFVWKRPENRAFCARPSTKMEPWSESTFCLSGTVVNYTPKCFLFFSLQKGTLKWNTGGKWVWSESKNPGNIMHMREKMKFVWMTGRATFSPIDFILSKWKIGSMWEAH